MKYWRIDKYLKDENGDVVDTTPTIFKAKNRHSAEEKVKKMIDLKEAIKQKMREDGDQDQVGRSTWSELDGPFDSFEEAEVAEM